jgi:hypothetical protein
MQDGASLNVSVGDTVGAGSLEHLGVPPRLLLLNLVVVSRTDGPERSYQMGMSFPAIRPRSGAAEAVAHLGRTTTVGSSALPLLDPELRPALLVLGAAAPTRP